jgi:Type ISP C-terminal specificity domain
VAIRATLSAKSKVDAPKAILNADKDGGRLIIDGQTILVGVPPEAWKYNFGNRCALEWILDQWYGQKKRVWRGVPAALLKITPTDNQPLNLDKSDSRSRSAASSTALTSSSAAGAHA